MTSRYALIRYTAPDGSPSIGSGMLVRDGTVLTADHIADGTSYQVVCGSVAYGVERVIRSGSIDVDLAVLILADSAEEAHIDRAAPMKFAEVDRSRADEVTGCTAVGFPRWNIVQERRASAQVKGLIRTADGVRMMPDGPDGDWLTLVGDRGLDARVPILPEGDLAPEPNSPWGGMSGAIVAWQDAVIGVVRSHNPAKGAGSLAVTPLTALRRLPKEKQREFCHALGIAGLDRMHLICGNTAAPAQAGAEQLAGPAFSSAEVRDRYGPILRLAGLEVPDRWDASALDELRRLHKARDATSDLLEALSVALDAVPILEQVGGREIAFNKLVYLYHRHVGCWPDASTREGLLIQAASAGILEQRAAALNQGFRPEPLVALARFLLGIAGHWNALTRRNAAPTLDHPLLDGLADWLTETLRQQREDAAHYLETMTGGRVWALIELIAPESPEGNWPDAIVIHTVTEHGTGKPQRMPCTPTKDGVLTALRDVVNDGFLERDVVVDLVMPRHLLEAGIEHWEVVKVGTWHESLTRHYQPRLRWSMHVHDTRLRKRLKQRDRDVNWLAAPETIPEHVTSDPASFEAWLDEQDRPGGKHPPYFTARTVRSRNQADDFDPLGRLLQEGYGFAVWFGSGTPAGVTKGAQEAANGLSAPERRNELPQRLAVSLRAHRPAVIWSDPDGRDGLPLPEPRGAGTRRGGTR